jgi:predicted transcriptional regulator
VIVCRQLARSRTHNEAINTENRMPENDPRLPQLVRDLMTVGVATCPPETPVVDLARLFVEKTLEAVVVLEEGNAVGVISQAELIRTFSAGNYAQLNAVDIMTDGIPKTLPDLPLQAVAQMMLDQDTRVLYLTHHAGGVEYPAGVITYQHILRLMAARNNNDLRDLGIQAERESPLEAFIRKRDSARNRKIYPQKKE